jgi:hypothetical protein
MTVLASAEPPMMWIQIITKGEAALLAEIFRCHLGATLFLLAFQEALIYS